MRNSSARHSSATGQPAQMVAANRDLRGAVRCPATGGESHRSGPWPVYGVRPVSPVSDLTSDRPLVERLPPEAPGGRSAPPDVELLIAEAAVAVLMAQVIKLAGDNAIFPGHGKTLGERAMEHQSVCTALLAAEDVS